MRQCFIMLFSILLLNGFSQTHFPKDTILNFSLIYTSSGGESDNCYTVKINSRGKIKATYEIMGGKQLSKKTIQLDNNSFRQFKNIIVAEASFYSIQDTLKRQCRDCSFERLEIKSNYGIKVLEGYNLSSISDKAELIFDTIEKVVGFIGTEEDIE